MTRTTSAGSRPRRETGAASRYNGARLGFTMVELLVVLGIIVLLAGLLLPVIHSAYKTGQRTRMASDLQAISTALEAYKADFGDYPRPEPDLTVNNVGFAILCKALVGPGDAVTPPANYDNSQLYGAGAMVTQSGVQYIHTNPFLITGKPTTDTVAWSPFDITDGADGPGTRARAGGKVWPPYLDMAKFRTAEGHGCALLDIFGQPILYFPASPANPNIHVTTIQNGKPIAGFVDQSPYSFYNADDNFNMFRRTGVPAAQDKSEAMFRIQTMLGDRNLNGVINAPETPASTAPFLLWSAGPDEKFGPNAYDSTTTAIPVLDLADTDKCDDVTNFR